MRWGNADGGKNPSAPLIENTILCVHSKKLDANSCFQAEDIMGIETLLLRPKIDN